MSFLFKMPSMPAPPQLEMPKVENVPSAEDEARLAQLKVELIEKETASVKMRRRVVTEVNALDREIAA